MIRLRLPVLVLTGLVLVGCGSEPVPNQLAAPAVLPSPSASAVPSANPATTAPAEQAPERPSDDVSSEKTTPVAENTAARDAREVEQLVRDYYAAADRALATGDVASIEAFFIPECTYCREDVDFIRRNLARGTIEGSRTVIRAVTVQDVGPEMASVLVDMFMPDGRVIGPDGEVVGLIDNGEGGPTAHALLRTRDGWRIAQVVEP